MELYKDFVTQSCPIQPSKKPSGSFKGITIMENNLGRVMLFGPSPAGDCDKEKTTGAVAAKVLPWIQDTMQGFGVGLRRTESERLIGWCNYVTSGVLSAGKAEFTVNTITSMAHANPRTFCAVVMLPNRSGDLRTPTKCLAFISSCFNRKANGAMFCSSVW